MATIHDSAAHGYAGAASTYESGRPDYPPEAEIWLRDGLGLRPGKRVLDLGAGTGKFTPRLLATGATVTALEPVDAMRDKLSRKLPEVTAIGGTAEAIPLPDTSLDAVVCAQAFHWFATHAALAEITRVLVPGGKLGLIWNGRDESVDWVARLSEITDSYNDSETPRYLTGAWRQAFPAPGLQQIDERHATHHHVGSVETVLIDRTLSVSFIAALPPERKHEAEGRVRDLIAHTPELRRDKITFPYVTSMFTFQKTETEAR